MAIEKAKVFVKAIMADEKLKNMLGGFTMDELKQAGQELKGSGELSDADLDKVAGGGGDTCAFCGLWINE